MEFEPELHLETQEKADLVGTMSTPGFKILNKIAKASCDKFIVSLLNTETENKEAVYANFLKAQVAAQLYTMFVNKLNEERAIYLSLPRAGDKPIDTTEGLLDIGDLPSIELDEEFF